MRTKLTVRGKSSIIIAKIAEKMTFVHESPHGPELTWDQGRLAGVLGAVRYRQGRLLGRMEALGFDFRAEARLATLTTDVVKSSAIEGETLNAEEVRSSIARHLGLAAAGTSMTAGRDVEGVVELMLDATQRHAEPLTAERLFGWHACLFPSGRSGMHRIAVGAWRPVEAGPMRVVSGPIGKESVHFEAPAADRLDREMTAFLNWFEGDRKTDPVLKAGVAHFWFVTIHPFEDGNGRIARAIADLALARAEETEQRFYSLSSQIEAERKDYYLQLEHAQRGGLDITDWLDWFLGCLGRAIQGAEEALSAVRHKAKRWERLSQHSLNERQRKIINKLLDGFDGKLTSSKYAKLAKCSDDTALRDIRALLDLDVLIKNEAGGRSTSYELAGPCAP